MKPDVNLNLIRCGVLGMAILLGGALIATPAEAVAQTSSTAQAAAGSINGTVVDSEGEPVIGATVMVKGTTIGTATDIDGQFHIKAAPGQEVIIKGFGYETATIKVTNQKDYSVTLKLAAQSLDDVVVIGYGTQKKGDVTSAVASVKAEDFTVGAIGDASELVKGKVAGLTITKGSGDPNAESTIRLRGVISLQGSSTPLVLVDGVEGGLGTVAPENIASIDVLKDASAAAIYGTRGANGVILITTKSGIRNAKTTVTYAGYGSWANLAKKHKFMTADQIRQGLTNFSDRGYDTDWLDAITRTAFTHNHDVQISGGSATTTYAGNFSYRRAEGVINTSFNEEMKMNFDISHWFFNDMLKLHLGLIKGYHKDNGLDAAESQIYRQAIMRNPTEPIYDENGLPYENFGITYYYNPVGLIEERDGEVKNEWSRMHGDITFEPIKGWQTKLLLSTNRSNWHKANFNSSNYQSHRTDGRAGDASHRYDYSRTDLLEVTSNYRTTFAEKHRFEALVGYSWEKNTNEGFSAWNADFNNDTFKWNNIGIGQLLKDGKASMSSYKDDDKLIGFFGRVSYGFDNRYNVLVSIRREGSSKFGANHKWGNFPSVSAGWNIMNEDFWSKLPVAEWWNVFKLRVGYGVTGVIPGYSYLSLTRYNFGQDDNGYGLYFYNNGKWIQGMQIASNPNPDLKWETSGELNIGLDWEMFNGRFGGSFDFYNKETRDMLWDYDVPVPPNRYPITTANVGKMRNTGIELMLRGIPVQTRDFEWNTTVTLSHNSNKLLSLSNDLYETANEHETAFLGEPITQCTHRLEVGKAVDRYFGIKSVGVSENGLWLVENPTTGEVAELTDAMLPDSNWKQDLGNSLPKVYLGWSNTFRYKQFDLSMQFTGQFGFKILNEARAYYENNSVNYNRLQSVLDAPYGDRTLAGNQKQTFVSYYLENGDFLKLTNLTLGYNVPFKTNKWISGLRIYFSCENLFTITGYKGLDPELQNSDATVSGIEWRDNYPTIRSFTVGLQATF